jgi:hypothetical protein
MNNNAQNTSDQQGDPSAMRNLSKSGTIERPIDEPSQTMAKTHGKCLIYLIWTAIKVVVTNMTVATANLKQPQEGEFGWRNNLACTPKCIGHANKIPEYEHEGNGLHADCVILV